jgi:hypothetical protein
VLQGSYAEAALEGASADRVGRSTAGPKESVWAASAAKNTENATEKHRGRGEPVQEEASYYVPDEVRPEDRAGNHQAARDPGLLSRNEM